LIAHEIELQAALFQERYIRQFSDLLLRFPQRERVFGIQSPFGRMSGEVSTH
jgi:hypothetical protein